jgi:hypothetical protein
MRNHPVDLSAGPGNYSVKFASDSLGISEEAVRKHCRSGRIKATKIGRDWVIDAGAFDDFTRKAPQIGRVKPTRNVSPIESDLPTSHSEGVEDEATLCLISVGLQKIRRAAGDRSGLLVARNARTAPARGKLEFSSLYSPELIQGWSQLSALCLDARKPIPGSIVELYDWCRRPLGDWPFREPFHSDVSSAGSLIDVALYDTDSHGLTAECECWARVSRLDLRSILDEERIVLPVRDLCRHEARQREYTDFRRFLIEHPVTTEAALTRFYQDRHLLPRIQAGLVDSYVLAPAGRAIDSTFYICPRCGEFLLRSDEPGALVCSAESCRRFPVLSTRRVESYPMSANVLAVRDGIRQFVTSPGRLEVELDRRLARMGAIVELWPGIDSYDLRITISENNVWAVDVKAWRDGHALGKHLRDKHVIAPDPHWTRAFYVFPDYLKDLSPHYLDSFFRGAGLQRGRFQADVLFASEFLKLCKRELGLHAV